jgi:MoxR-like ATPase
MVDVARTIEVAPKVKHYIVDLVEGTREHPEILLGASPRSALFMQRVARVRAAASGRGYVTPDDVKVLAAPVLGHRMALRPEAVIRGSRISDVVETTLEQLQVPGTINAHLAR